MHGRLAKWLGAGSIIAGLIAAVTSRLTRRRRKSDSAGDSNHGGQAPSSSDTQAACSGTLGQAQGAGTWSGLGPHTARISDGDGKRSSEGQGQSSGLLSRLMVLGRPSESLESAISFSGAGDASSTNGAFPDDYDSSEEQDADGADSRTGYGKSDRARLVDMWIESALLVSRDVRLDKRHFDRTTRQNLKKMRPASAQAVLSEIADRCWDGSSDIAKEVHRLVSHAKAQDKFAVGSAVGPATLITSGGRSSLSSSSGGGGGVSTSAAAVAAAAAAAGGSLSGGGSRLVL